MDSLAVSCVVDTKPQYYRQCIHWIATLLVSGTVKANEIVVHVIGDQPAVFLDLLEFLGVRALKIKSFASNDSPYCNKLMQLKSRYLFGFDRIVLMDTDMAVVENIRSILCTRSLAAKTVDTSSPPIDILLQLLKRSKINREPKIVSSDFGVGGTFLGNCNGGVYVISREKFRELAPIWLKWAYWMLDQKRILGNYIKHTDQISFCFALLELNMDIELLDLEMNFPTHLKPTTYCDLHGISPKILHYHANASSFGVLQPIGRETVDSAIAKANASIKSFQSLLPPRFFVNDRLCFETLL